MVSAFCLAAWRALEQVTVPGVNPGLIAARLEAVDTSSLIHAIGPGSIALSSYSIVALGLRPYINALIAMALVQLISKPVRALRSSAEGRRRLEVWTRAVAVLFAMGAGYGQVVLLQYESAFPASIDWFPKLLVILELTGGTLILLWLADILDEYGLGFGNGAFLIYALGPLAVDMHGLADMLASAPAIGALYLPVVIWILMSLAIAAATIAVLVAVRRVQPSQRKNKRSEPPLELRFLMSGVLRPPLFTSAVLSLPAIIANSYAQANPFLVRWLADYATPYGPNAFTDTGFVALETIVVIAFTYFVVAFDWQSSMRPELIPHANRLTFMGGIFLALAVYVVPVLDWNATKTAGHTIPISGLEVVLAVTLILAVVVSVEGSRRGGADSPILFSRVP